MIYQFLVPTVPEVEEVRILEWHRQESTLVEAGKLLVELETDKAVVEVRLKSSKHLRRILCQPGDWQKLGNPLALFSDTADEPLPESPDANLPVLEADFEVT